MKIDDVWLPIGCGQQPLAAGVEQVATAGEIFVNCATSLCGNTNPVAILFGKSTQIFIAFTFPPVVAGLPVAGCLLAVQSWRGQFKDDSCVVLAMCGKQCFVADVCTDRDAKRDVFMMKQGDFVARRKPFYFFIFDCDFAIVAD